MPTSLQPGFVLLFRLAMAWTFLYAASRQVLNANWNVADFLNATATFHDVYGVFTGALVAAVVSFLVAWGHLLIGLSLLVGLMVRVSATIGAVLMLLYWAAYMDFPYVGGDDNFLVDFHLIYALILFFLAATHAGHVFGLDAWASRVAPIRRRPTLRALFE
jgi:thiosulfate dehydrogenase (quinone) large subunit